MMALIHRHLGILLAVGLSWLTSPASAATTEQGLRLGDSLTGTILAPNADSVGAVFTAVKDTQVSFTIKASKGSTLEPAVTLKGDSGMEIDLGDFLIPKGLTAQVKNFPIPETDTYTLEISGAAGNGDFSLTSKAKFPKKVELLGSVPGAPEITLDVQPGSEIKATVSAEKGSSLLPTIDSVTDEGGELVLEGNTSSGTKAKFKSAVAETGGTVTIAVGGTGEGNFTAKVNLKAPKSKEAFDVREDIKSALLAAIKVDAEPAAADWNNFPALMAMAKSAVGKGSTGRTYAGEFNMTGSSAGLPDIAVDIRAAYDDAYFYMRFQWTDPSGTNDLNRRRWFFNGGEAAAKPDWDLQDGMGTITSNPGAEAEDVPAGWSSNLNDDKVGVAWAISDPKEIKTDGTNEAGLADGTTFHEAGCAVACHSTLEMAPPIGLIDLWHWKTSRSNPIGFVNDQFGGGGAKRTTDTGEGLENRNRVSTNSSGPTRVLDPAAANVMVDKAVGTAIINFESVVNGAIPLDGRLNLTFEASMPIESTDAVGGQAVFSANCSTGCHGADGKGVGKDFARTGLTWTRQEILDKANNVVPHGGGDRGLDGAISVEDTNKLIARIRSFAGAPGYWLREGDGVTFTADDIPVARNFATVYDAATGQYTLIVRRKLTTSKPDQDVQFSDMTKTFYFGVAVMDFDGKNHAGAPLLKMVFGK